MMTALGFSRYVDQKVRKTSNQLPLYNIPDFVWPSSREIISLSFFVRTICLMTHSITYCNRNYFGATGPLKKQMRNFKRSVVPRALPTLLTL